MLKSGVSGLALYLTFLSPPGEEVCVWGGEGWGGERGKLVHTYIYMSGVHIHHTSTSGFGRSRSISKPKSSPFSNPKQKTKKKRKTDPMEKRAKELNRMIVPEKKKKKKKGHEPFLLSIPLLISAYPPPPLLSSPKQTPKKNSPLAACMYEINVFILRPV